MNKCKIINMTKCINNKKKECTCNKVWCHNMNRCEHCWWQLNIEVIPTIPPIIQDKCSDCWAIKR